MEAACSSETLVPYIVLTRKTTVWNFFPVKTRFIIYSICRKWQRKTMPGILLFEKLHAVHFLPEYTLHLSSVSPSKKLIKLELIPGITWPPKSDGEDCWNPYMGVEAVVIPCHV
jgi:hypothetical protein